MKKNILVYGLGNFGYAILKRLDDKLWDNYQISWFDRKKELIQNLEQYKTHTLFHKEHSVSNWITFYNDKQLAVSRADIIVLAITSSALLEVIPEIKKSFKDNVIICNTVKALSQNALTYSQEISSLLRGQNFSYNVISWGTIASDLFLWFPLWATIAWEHIESVQELKKIFEWNTLHIETSPDVLGVEYAGVFKNIWSILAGYVSASWYPYGTETYILSKLAWEIEKLCITHLGANAETFSMQSQCWGNDYWMSCTGNTRNRQFWELLWWGMKYNEAIEEMQRQNKTVEWVNTLKSLKDIFVKNRISLEYFPTIKSILKLPENLPYNLIKNDRYT